MQVNRIIDPIILPVIQPPMEDEIEPGLPRQNPAPAPQAQPPLPAPRRPVAAQIVLPPVRRNEPARAAPVNRCCLTLRNKMLRLALKAGGAALFMGGSALTLFGIAKVWEPLTNSLTDSLYTDLISAISANSFRRMANYESAFDANLAFVQLALPALLYVPIVILYALPVAPGVAVTMRGYKLWNRADDIR